LKNPMISAGYRLLEWIDRYRERVRGLFYAVMLFREKCPHCGSSDLGMVKDSWCRCRTCRVEFDPTLALQTCSDCGSGLSKKLYRYWCPKCRRPVKSHYSFDATVFDATYFRERMRESRERKQQKREVLRRMLAETRSLGFVLETELQLAAIPGLEEALDGFVAEPLPKGMLEQFVQRPAFDLEAYRTHILEIVQGCVLHFDGIMPLVKDRRLDRIFRFISLIFLQHQGLVVLTQKTDGEILVEDNEAHTKRY